MIVVKNLPFIFLSSVKCLNTKNDVSFKYVLNQIYVLKQILFKFVILILRVTTVPFRKLDDGVKERELKTNKSTHTPITLT